MAPAIYIKLIIALSIIASCLTYDYYYEEDFPVVGYFEVQRNDSINTTLGSCRMEKSLGFENVSGWCFSGPHNQPQQVCVVQYGLPEAIMTENHNDFCPLVSFDTEIEAQAYNSERRPCYVHAEARLTEEGGCMMSPTNTPRCVGSNLTQENHTDCMHLATRSPKLTLTSHVAISSSNVLKAVRLYCVVAVLVLL